MNDAPNPDESRTTLESKLRALSFSPVIVGQLLSETERIRLLLSQKGITLSDEQLIREATLVRKERDDRTVLISDPDPAVSARLITKLGAENYRVVSCPSFESLEALVKGRRSDFYFTGILYTLSNSDSARLPALHDLVRRTVTPSIIIKYSATGQDIRFSNYIPHPASAQHVALLKLLNEVAFSGASESNEGSSGGFVQIELLSPNKTDELYHRAERHRMERSFASAVADYASVLSKDPLHLGAVTGFASLLLRKKVRQTVLSDYFPDGLAGLVSFLRDKKLHLKSENVGSLLGEALVLLYDERVSSGSSHEQCQHLLSDAVAALEDYRSLNDVNKNRPNVLAYLALGYSFMNTPDSKRRAYELIDVAIRHSDVIGEGISPTTQYERHVARTLGWKDLDLGGSRLMQLTGMNRVLELTDDVVIKHFSMKDFEHARTEVRNISTLAAHADELTFTIDGVERRLVIPSRAHLLYREEDLNDPTASVYVIMPKLSGEGLAAHFEDLDAIPRDLEDKETRKLAVSTVHGIKQEHLEWLVDSCARLQVVGTRHLELSDVREKSYGITIGAEVKTVGFCAKRAFDKLFGSKAALVGRDKVSNKKKLDALKLFRSIDDSFKECPDWLWLFYSDNNIRNYLIEYTGDSPSNRQDWVSNSKKMRVDFENSDLRFGATDPISAVEHELAYMGESPRKVSSINDYLMNRWLARVMIARLPDYWQTNAPSEEDGRNYQITMFEQFSSKFHNIIDTKRNGERRKDLSDLMAYYLPRIQPGLTLQNFRQLWHTESMLRHMTIVADKEKEIGLINRRLNDMRNKYDYLGKYEPLGTWTYEFKRFEQDKRDDENSGIYLLYCKLQKSKEQLEADRVHHLNYFFSRVDELGLDKLRKYVEVALKWKSQ